jgi:hypothetical protein
LTRRRRRETATESSGKLKIGNSWNAITIIALSQGNPLKAVAEFVENSIDAGARHITIARGKERGQMYLRVTDDGEGIPLDEQGIPNFPYVATHICDSVKRQLKEKGARGIQGEYGIGLLSFWTVGEKLTLISPAADGRAYEMQMIKGDPGYRVRRTRALFSQRGTELVVQPLLAGIRQLSGEKMQWYLASELRDRLRTSGAQVRIVDRQARKQFKVEPRRFGGRLLHQLTPPVTMHGDVYVELYLDTHHDQNRVGLFRSGTRVLSDIALLDRFQGGPWVSGHLQGIIDAPFLTLTPGTRSSVIQDDHYDAFCAALMPLARELESIIEEQRKAEEERASRKILQSVQKALTEALLALPEDEYDWFDIRKESAGRSQRSGSAGSGKPTGPPGGGDGTGGGDLAGPDAIGAAAAMTGAESQAGDQPRQPRFFEVPGPLYSVRIAPASCTLPVRESRTFQAIARDRKRTLVQQGLRFAWEIVSGQGDLANADGEIATYRAPEEPGLTTLQVRATQGEIVCTTTALVTVTDSLITEMPRSLSRKRGLPGYTFHKEPGKLWRSRYDGERNIIVINNGHRDFVYASRSQARKIRYICKLFAKELVIVNFPGLNAEKLLERMIELSLYTEENL